jgi:hypothetical protein
MYEGAPNSKHDLAPRMPADLQQTAGAEKGRQCEKCENWTERQTEQQEAQQAAQEPVRS